MFTQKQIAAGGFLGVYAGCMAISINLGRIPYRRGSIIGIFFGSLAQLLITLIDIYIAMLVANATGDTILKNTQSWIYIIICWLIIQILSSIGCTIMARYFNAPQNGHQSFDRDGLYHRLRDRDTGKRSVLHDVVLCMENYPALKDIRFSWGWIILCAIFSILSFYTCIHLLMNAILDVLFFGVPMDIFWWGMIAFKLLIVAGVLMIINFSARWILCHDSVH